ncbi:reverse transcriptase domain-containing protein [Tanacetum coccineum]
MKSVSMKQRLARKKSLKKKLMQKESVSKQGRKSAKSTPTTHTNQVFDDVDVNDAMNYIETDAYMQKGSEVRTAKPKEVEVSTDKLDEDDETIAEFLVSMSQNKAKQKGVEIKDAKDSDRPRATSTRSVLTLKPLPKIDPKDKGKKVLEEEAESDAESEGVDEAERKFDQLAKDEEIARKARIEVDRLLAARLQEEERETFTVEERAKFLYDTIAAQRRFLAQQRAVAIRSRPPTRTQLRYQMITYLKHVGGKKHANLKNKNFEEIQVLYKEVKRSDKNFIAIGSAEDERHIKEMNKESKDPKKKRLKKRLSMKLQEKKTQQRKRPRPQPDDDSDDEHRKCLRIVTFYSTIDSEIMETKSFVSKLHKVSSPDGDCLVVYRVNGHFRAFNYLMEILWGDLKIMMESSTKENDQELKDGTVIYMLVERRYPLFKELLQRMLDLGLGVEEESTVALHLLASPGSNSSWLSIHLVVYNEELAIPEQTATGKGISNLLMAGSLPKTTKPTMPPKRMSTSEGPAMTQAAIRKLVTDSVTATLEAQAANMANTDNTTRPREAPMARQCSYKEFMSCQPINFKDGKVNFATGTLTGEALYWWNSFAQPIRIEKAYKITWVEFKKLLIKKYCPRTEVQKMKDEFYHLTVKGNDLKTYVRRF